MPALAEKLVGTVRTQVYEVMQKPAPALDA
jgi:hypothetical protein